MNQTEIYFFYWRCDFFFRKGIIAASLAKLLQARGYRTTIQFDPYLNVDQGL
jgi:CTP synthase